MNAFAYIPTPNKRTRLNKSLLSNFNKEKRVNISFDELISISTSKKTAKGITSNDIAIELQNRLNYYKQVLAFKTNQFNDYAVELKSFEKHFLSYFQKTSNFDIDAFNRLKGDFEKIQMTFDQNVLNHAEKFEWEIFQSSANNFFDYLQNSLNKIKEVNMKEITEAIIIKAQNIDLDKEALLWNRISAKGIRKRERLNELSSAKEYLNKKRKRRFSGNTNELFKNNFKQTYLVKENKEIKHMEFDKEDLGKPIKGGKWIRLAWFVLKEETIQSIIEIIDSITTAVFNKYFLISKEIGNESRIKMVIYGRVYSKKRVVHTMKSVLQDKLTQDSIVKIYYYGNDRTALMKSGLLKVKHISEYNITTNMSIQFLSKF